MTRRVGRMFVPAGLALGTLLFASGLYAQPPSPNPIEVVYSTNSSDDRILRLDFATGTSTVVNTDARQISRLSGLAVRNDGSAVHLLVCDSVGDAVLFYENAAGAGQPITTEIRFPDGVSLDQAGNAYVVTGNVRHEVWKIPRGGPRPGGYGAPVPIDPNVPSTLLEDTKVVPFSAGRLQQGDLLVLSRVPATIFRYPKADCAPGDPACTGFGPRQVFLPESAFPEGAKPTGLAFAPNRDLLVSRHVGEILRYNPDGLRVQPDFASGLGEGRFKMAVGVQDGRSYAFVVNRSGGGGVQRFLINEDGTGTPDGAVNDKVSNPNGVGLASAQAAPTPAGGCPTAECEPVVVVPAPEIVLTFDNVLTPGITTARIIEFEDNRGARHGNFEVDQSLKDFFPEGSPLRQELPDVTIPAHVQAFRKSDPIAGVPTFLLSIIDSTATFRRTVEFRYDEAEQLGYEPSCTDADPTQQPRTFYAPEIDPPKSEPPIVEGPVFTDVTTGCGSNIGRGSDLSLWLTARDTRDVLDIVDTKRADLSAVLDFYPCIDPGTRGLLQAELQAAAAAFDAYEETGDAAQQALAIVHLDAFIGLVDANPGGFESCDASLNVGGALIVRAESAKFMIAKVVVVPLVVIKHVVNDNGGTAVASDFTVSVAGNRRRPASFPGDEGGTMVGLRPGTPGTSGDYFVTEIDDQDQDGVTDSPGLAGYRVTLSAGCSGTITAATESVTCLITNDDIPPGLTLVKVVTNDNGGTAVAADFTLSASGPTPIAGAGGASSGPGFSAGTYTLSESGPSGYSASAWTCTGGTQSGNQITLGVGQSAACTITNDDIAPSLTLVKVVTNNNGGTAAATDFTLTASGTTPTPISGAGGATSDGTFWQGTYTLSETGPPGYAASPWSCSGGTQAGSQITLGLGQSATCEITNDDIAPSLTLVKVVVNDNGGTAVPADFTLSASGPTPISGAGGATSDGTFHQGTYTLSETGPPGYAASPWSCRGATIGGGNQITLRLAESATCEITNDDSAGGPATVSAVFFGGAGDQRGSGIAISGGALYVSGDTAANGFDGLVARYSLPLTDGASPSWSKTWPSAAGGDEFLGVSVSTEGVYLAGSSFSRTSDIVGGKENKGTVVKFPLTGPPGGGFDGATWDRQTPAPPGAFGYGGGEGLAAIATAVEGGQPYAYATGSSQSGFFNGGRLYLSKLDAAGSVLWTRTDSAITPFSRGYAVAILNGNAYVAGRNDDDGTMRPYLLKYDSSGNLLWSRRTTTLPGQYLGLAAFGGALYTVGQSSSGSASDFLIEKWDEAGDKLWSQQYDRSSAEDIVYGVVGLGSRLYAAGSTRGGTAGGADVIILEIDPSTGASLSSTLFGGAQDDIGRGAATDGTYLYVVGESRSFANAGNAVGQNDVMVLRYVPGP